MACSVELTDTFVQEYADALDHLCNVLHSPKAAADLMQEVDSARDLLADMPRLHAVSSWPYLKKHGIRIHLAKNYAILYTYSDDALLFLRFVHQTQCYDSESFWNMQ